MIIKWIPIHEKAMGQGPFLVYLEHYNTCSHVLAEWDIKERAIAVKAQSGLTVYFDDLMGNFMGRLKRGDIVFTVPKDSGYKITHASYDTITELPEQVEPPVAKTIRDKLGDTLRAKGYYGVLLEDMLTVTIDYITKFNNHKDKPCD